MVLDGSITDPPSFIRTLSLRFIHKLFYFGKLASKITFSFDKYHVIINIFIPVCSSLQQNLQYRSWAQKSPEEVLQALWQGKLGGLWIEHGHSGLLDMLRELLDPELIDFAFFELQKVKPCYITQSDFMNLRINSRKFLP